MSDATEVTPPQKRRRDDAVTWGFLKGWGGVAVTVIGAAVMVGMAYSSARGDVASLHEDMASQDGRVTAVEKRLDGMDRKLDALLCLTDPNPPACLRRLAALPP